MLAYVPSLFSRVLPMMSSPLTRHAPLLLLLAACRAAAPVSPTPPTQTQPAPSPDPLEGLSRLIEAQPDNGGAAYALASLHASRGEHAQALRWLERLVELRWSFAPLDTDFGAFASTPEYRAVADRLAANEPQVARSRTAFTLPERDLIPEGIAHDPVTDTFFVSSIRKRKVVAVSRDGKVRDFTAEGQRELWSMLGMKVDAGRRHLWVASFADRSMKSTQPEDVGHARLLQYDLRSGQLTAVQAPPGETLQGVDGLSLYRGSLIAIQNGLGRARLSRLDQLAEPVVLQLELGGR